MRYLTGIQPSGDLHIGNYFWAIKPMIDSQSDNNELYVFVANYHAMTTVQDGKKLSQLTRDVLETYLAAGLLHANTTVYLQSQVPEVQELAWYLSQLVTVSELERAHSYKDKVANGKTPNHGLFAYPVLMAADILMFEPDFVPVGKDQKQHVEFARDWAQTFHRVYGETFKLPEPKIQEEISVVLWTDGRKMSKSYGNVIGLFDDEKTIRKAIMGIVTDSKSVEESKDPETCQVFRYYKLLASPQEVEDMKSRYYAGGFGYGHAKQALFEKYMEYFGPLRERKVYYKQHPEEVDAILEASAAKLRPQVDMMMSLVRKKVGIIA